MCLAREKHTDGKYCIALRIIKRLENIKFKLIVRIIRKSQKFAKMKQSEQFHQWVKVK